MRKRLFSRIPPRLWKRHFRHLVRYASLRKILNAILATYHYLNGHRLISTMPVFLKVELSRHCAINCPYCFSEKNKRFYSFENFKLLVDDLGQYVFMAQLYEIGEPLHHKEILNCITYAHNKKIGTIISSTLSLKKPDSFWENLVTSGLDTLIVAIDGISSPTYKRYRTNGNLRLVMSNLKKILKFRNQRKSRLFIEWQMIDFSWNRSEQDDARRLAKSLGCDRFQLIQNTYERRVLGSAEGKYLRSRNCLWPYVLLLVNVYGDVVPCFYPYCSPGVLGNLDDSTFGEIWNGKEIQRIRSKELIELRAGCSSCTE